MWGGHAEECLQEMKRRLKSERVCAPYGQPYERIEKTLSTADYLTDQPPRPAREFGIVDRGHHQARNPLTKSCAGWRRFPLRSERRDGHKSGSPTEAAALVPLYPMRKARFLGPA